MVQAASRGASDPRGSHEKRAGDAGSTGCTGTGLDVARMAGLHRGTHPAGVAHHDRVLAKGIAPTLVAEQQEREKLAAELVEARSKIDELTDRLDKLEAAPRSNAGLRAGLTASRLQ